MLLIKYVFIFVCKQKNMFTYKFYMYVCVFVCAISVLSAGVESWEIFPISLNYKYMEKSFSLKLSSDLSRN